jgi:bifunctional UDP-N-acetylglucosamine pyrophosphorylase/glucosamine-1-phosphate N-acetyltransferase
VVEAKEPGDASAAELEIREVNAGIYAFAAEALGKALGALSNDNAQGEYYLPDVLPLIGANGAVVVAHKVADDSVNLGVNDRVQLAAVNEVARQEILARHMRAGVTIVDPAATWIDAEVELAPDVTIEPGTTLKGATRVGAGSVVGPMTTLIDARLGERVTAPHSYLTECEVGDGAAIGPFAYLRPDAAIGEDAKAGAFTEIKNSRIGKGAKVPHLSYVGDAEIGAGANLGAGTITANYDGFRKHRTKVGEDARVGVDTSLVAPVEVGDGAYTGAGSVITDDVPPGALGINRGQQENVEGYAEKAKRSKKGKGS